MKRSTILSFFLFMCFFNQAQTNLDSLYAVWQDTNHSDSTRIAAYKNYIWNGFLFSLPDTAFILAEELIAYGLNKNYVKAQAVGYNIQFFYLCHNEFQSNTFL